VRLLLPDITVLAVVELPPREPWPASQLATLYQPDSGDVLKLICVGDTAPALRIAEAPVTVELRGRPIETGDKGRAFKFQITGVAESGGRSE
jgi:hypothetical protein